MATINQVVRVGDMHPTRALELEQQTDGDVVLTITQGGLIIGEPEFGDESRGHARIEFCVSELFFTR